MVARAVQPGIEKAKAQALLLVGRQVHHHEGGIVEHVDPAQCRVELDAVEGGHAVIQPHHIGQVQVAMAFAYMAVRLAGGPQGRQRVGFGA